MSQQLTEILWNTLDVGAPLEIKQPEVDFNEHLLRCKALDNEKGTHTFIIKRPGQDFEFEVLPEDYKKREKINKKWSKMCDAKKYVSVLIEPKEEMLDTFCETLKIMQEHDYVDITREYSMSIMGQWLRGFEILAAVWHIGQIGDDGILIRPHIHLLFKKVKKITKEEKDMIHIE